MENGYFVQILKVHEDKQIVNKRRRQTKGRLSSGKNLVCAPMQSYVLRIYVGSQVGSFTRHTHIHTTEIFP